MSAYSDMIRAAARAVAARTTVAELAAWWRGEHESEAIPARPLVREVRGVWPTRTIPVEHVRAGRRSGQWQDTLVVPLLLLERLAVELGWEMSRLVRGELED